MDEYASNVYNMSPDNRTKGLLYVVDDAAITVLYIVNQFVHKIPLTVTSHIDLMPYGRSKCFMKLVQIENKQFIVAFVQSASVSSISGQDSYPVWCRNVQTVIVLAR